MISNDCNNTVYNSESSNQTNQDPCIALSYEVLLEVFSLLKSVDLGRSCCVNRTWNILASESIIWKKVIYREIAFGDDKWAHYFGSEVIKDEASGEDFYSLPTEHYIAACRQMKNVFPEKNPKNSFILARLPKTLNGGLTIKSLGELAKKHFSSNTSTGYRDIYNQVFTMFAEKSIDQSRWVMMTKDVLPESKGKNYEEQEKIIADLAKSSLVGCEVPGILESIACIFSQYFSDPEASLFGNSPYTYTRCKESLEGVQIIVGGFTSVKCEAPCSVPGLQVTIREEVDDDGEILGNNDLGIAALKKF